jgi:uncharacterized membrane protein YdbT with pleckstrin-like domain/CRP-like cAMP-binding protein
VDQDRELDLKAFLGQVKIFKTLSGEELEDLADICEIYEYDQGALIAYERDVADGLFIVHDGYLYASRIDEQGVARDARQYMPKNYFNDLWLFEPRTHSQMIKGGEAGQFLFIRHDRFIEYLDLHPTVIDKLDLSDAAEKAAEQSLYVEPGRQIETLGLLADEIIEYYARRSTYLLGLKTGWPLVLAALWIALIGLTLSLSNTATLLLALIPAGGLILFSLFQFLDWRNDYFVITNKHLIHREFDLRRLRATVNKTPIDQIQSVEVQKPGLLATLLNTGTARVTTAAQAGAILFDFIDDPQTVKETLNELREQFKALDLGRAQASMRQAVEKQFEASPTYRKVEQSLDNGQEDEDELVDSPFGLLLERIRRGVSPRVEEGNVITYRKHVFTLLGKARLPIGAGLIILVGLAVVPWFEVAVALLGLGFIDLAWLIWQFEDWRNDTFQVTDRYVIDIDRRPFGFGESRKQAELSNVQNVSADRPGLLATIFNYGDVFIETAGASADITFERVVNPNRIQSDIFHHREQVRQNQALRAGESRRQEYALLLDVYQQASEQGRLPRRTPPEPENPQ